MTDAMIDRAYNLGFQNGGNESDGEWTGDRIAEYFRAPYLSATERMGLRAAYIRGAQTAETQRKNKTL